MSTDREPSVFSGRLYFLASLFFVAGALVIAFPWLSGAVTIPWDAKAQAYPQLVFLAKSLASGESAFWTPNVYAGHPQIADPQSEIFSPPFLLLALFNHEPSFRAMDATVFAMLIVAGLALVAFFRDRGWHPAGALVAAFAVSFGGSAAWRIQHVGEVLSLCWFAITLLLLSRALTRSSWLYGLASGVAAGFMVLGRDQIAFLCMIVLAAYAIWHLFDGPKVGARLRHALPPLAAGFVGGVLTIAVPIALTFALAAQSNRPEIDFAGAGRGSLPPLSLLSAVVSNLYGVDGPLKDFWGPPASQVWGENDLALARNMGAIYFGAIPLAALAFAFTRLGSGTVRFFAIMAAFMLLYAVGRYTPFFRLAFAIPGVDLYRRPADATFPLGALLAILGGYGIHLVATGARGAHRWAGSTIVALLFAACVFVAWDKGRLAQATGPLTIGAVSLVIAVVALWIAPRALRAAPVLSLAGLATLMTLDLAVSNKPNESTALPPSQYDVLDPRTKNETIALIKDRLKPNAPDRRDRVELAAVDYEWPNAGLVHGFDHDLGFNPIRMKLFKDATNAQDQVAVPEQRTFSPAYAHFRSPLADLLGVRLVLSRYPLERMDPGFKPGDLNFVTQTKDAFVWENPRALPRVLMPGSAQRADFDAILTKGDWPQVDFTRSVLLDDKHAGEAAQHPPGSAKILHYGNTRIDIEASSPEGGWLVLNDIWHPWWFAQVDGEPAQILRANVMFRAVRLPAGTHRVRFTFHPLRGLWAQMRGG